jgi:hypothetical protein
MKAIESRCETIRRPDFTLGEWFDNVMEDMKHTPYEMLQHDLGMNLNKPTLNDEISLLDDNRVELQYRRLLTGNYADCTLRKSIDIAKELKSKLDNSTFEELVRSYVLIYGDDTTEIKSLLNGGYIILNEEYKDFDELYIDIIVDAAIDMIKPIIPSTYEEMINQMLSKKSSSTIDEFLTSNPSVHNTSNRFLELFNISRKKSFITSVYKDNLEILLKEYYII